MADPSTPASHPPEAAPTRLVLASGSPRRREMLEEIGVVFDVRPSDVDEAPLAGEDGPTYVARLAAEKALVAARPDAVVLAADTTVDLDGDLLGKPADRDEALGLLHRLSGSTHHVHTGVAVAWFEGEDATGPSVLTGVATTQVSIAELPAAWMDWWVSGPEPYDKAGGYALQGSGGVFVTSIHGSPSNVVGLPLDLAARLLAESGHDLLSFLPPG
ncbi:MAG: Maf family protein [Acidimicrobiales bacterium]|nr:Maf family protein [Acidimicrobiales bacterium]